MSARRAAEADAIEVGVAAMVREHRGAVELCRIEALMRLIERDAGLAVERCERGFCGDRVTLWLETGWTVKLHLYWPERRHIMTLSRLRWHDQVGWVIDAVSDDAEPMRCFAWRITVVLPRA